MAGFFTNFRAALLLGKGQKHFDNRRFSEALERALKAKQLRLEPQFELLCHTIEGKSRAHLGDHENALSALRRAHQIAGQILAARGDSKHLQNIRADLAEYIDKIEPGGSRCATGRDNSDGRR